VKYGCNNKQSAKFRALCICGFAAVLSPQIAIYKSQKIYGPQIATVAEALQIFKRIEVRRFADLVFADRPPLINKTVLLVIPSFIDFTKFRISFKITSSANARYYIYLLHNLCIASMPAR
jgi:hypothetical protein